LLTHLAGYAPDFDLRDHWSGYDGAIKRLVRESLRNPPGAKFVYSDINYIALGEVVHRVSGLTLDELAEVARVNTSRSVTVLRDLTEEQFREHLRRSNDPRRRYIVNFNRERIFSAGGGHHSPIGGYLEDEDLVFVLDVNSQFQPWLVERSRLFSAVNTHDDDKKRGLLLIE